MAPWTARVLALFEAAEISATSRLVSPGVVEFGARCHPSEIPEVVLECLGLDGLAFAAAATAQGPWTVFEANEPDQIYLTPIEAIAEGRAVDRAIRKVMSRGYDKGSAIAILKSRRVICQSGRRLKRC